MNDASLEMIWRPRTSLGDEGAIFAHTLYRHYSYPSYFCFDMNCADEPVMDDPRLEGYNADRRSSDFADYFKD